MEIGIGITNVFLCVSEICKVRGNLFHLGAKKEAMVLPDADGPVVQLSEKLYVPVQEHPEVRQP